MAGLYWVETLGCPKNRVDSEKLVGTLRGGGFLPAPCAEQADLLVVNSCAFVEEARRESIDTILELAQARREGARLVVTGCLAERYGTELSDAMPEIDLVAGFGVPVALKARPVAPAPRSDPAPEEPATSVRAPSVDVPPLLDLLNLPRPAVSVPWAYLKVAEGCDRRCGFCAIPQFRGRQRSRTYESILNELDELGDDVREVVLVAQDLASWGLDRSASKATADRRGNGRPIVGLVAELSRRVERVRLLYLYPSSLDVALIEAIVATGVPYFDLSLQHVSRRLLRSMRRAGDSGGFLEKIALIRSLAPDAALRSSFILGYPGETEEDHDQLLDFLEQAQLDWAGFFTFSEEDQTLAASLPDKIDSQLALERLRECSELQDTITASRRSALISQQLRVLVDEAGIARSHREAPEIDGVVHVPKTLDVGEIASVVVTGAAGPDLWASAVGTRAARSA